jgi:hypothetical protein
MIISSIAVDPKLFCSDPDPIFNPDPDPTSLVKCFRSSFGSDPKYSLFHKADDSKWLFVDFENKSKKKQKKAKKKLGNSKLHFRSDYLGEYEAICETVLARESGPYVGLIGEKKPEVENLVLLSL